MAKIVYTHFRYNNKMLKFTVYTCGSWCNYFLHTVFTINVENVFIMHRMYSPRTVRRGNQKTDPSEEPNQSLMGASAQRAARVCRVCATRGVLRVGTMAAVICGGARGVADDRASSALLDFSATLAFSRSVALSPALGDVQLST